MRSICFKFFIFSFFLNTSLLFSQQDQPLPKGLTSYEESIINGFDFKQSSRFSPAPDLPVRTPAQWEEVEYLVLRWTPEFQNIQRQIVDAAVKECKVLITTTNPTSVQNYLLSNGVDLTNVEFLNAPTNSIWIRDYAGNTVYTNDVGERALVDWIYNRPRPLDNTLPSQHATYFGMPIYITDTSPNDLVNTGGNFMSDGMGNAFASKLILSENAAGNPYGVSTKTEDQIDEILRAYMGINSYRKMEVLPYDGIHHIDMHMKLLDEETILVSKYPQGVADGPQIEENINYITSTFQTPFGNDYEIKWISAPPSTNGSYPDTGGSYRTYTNALILNKSVLIPTYRPQTDAEALQIWRDAMPGYNIVGIDVDNVGEDLISLGGAIHCITHTIGVAEPLWIVHEKLRAVSTTSMIPVEAMIKHISGIEQASVYWRVAGDTNFQQANMTNSSEDNWVANLTVPASAQKVEYYIWAKANSGKTLTRPLVAPDGYWTFDVITLSNEELADRNILGPFPNPAKDKVHFNLKNIEGKVLVSVFNVSGQKLYSQELPSGKGQLTLDLNQSWKGLLLVSFEGNFGKVTKKIIKN